MPKRPLISVIITCYNYERYISSCIESVLAQSFKNFEIIVVNDGSTDGSRNIIERYADNIKPIHTKNFGFISACMTGLSASRGSYIIFLDADDMLGPRALATVACHLTDEVSKIQFMLQPIDAVGIKIGDAFPNLPTGFGSKEMIDSINRLGCYPTPPTSGNVYRREIYTDLDSISYDFGIDGVAYLAAPFKGKVIHLPDVLGSYRIHNNNMSGFGPAQYLKMERDRDVFIKRLQHLSRIVAGDDAATGKLSIRQDYHYTLERSVFISIFNGSRPSMGLTYRYLKEVTRAFSGIERLSYIGLAVALFILPDTQRRKAMEFATNPRKESPTRTFIKRLVRNQPKISAHS